MKLKKIIPFYSLGEKTVGHANQSVGNMGGMLSGLKSFFIKDPDSIQIKTYEQFMDAKGIVDPAAALVGIKKEIALYVAMMIVFFLGTTTAPNIFVFAQLFLLIVLFGVLITTRCWMCSVIKNQEFRNFTSWITGR